MAPTTFICQRYAKIIAHASSPWLYSCFTWPHTVPSTIPTFSTLDEKLDLHIQQMWCKYKANATFDHVCSNLLLSVGPTLPHFYTQSKAGKCHICLTFATVSKSTDNMFFFTTFGCVAILMPNEAFCKYFARSFKFDLKIIFLYIFSMRAKLIKIVGFVHIC